MNLSRFGPRKSQSPFHARDYSSNKTCFYKLSQATVEVFTSLTQNEDYNEGIHLLIHNELFLHSQVSIVGEWYKEIYVMTLV